MAYLTAAQIDAKVLDLVKRFSPICVLLPLSNSVEGRPIHGLRIMGGPLLDYRPTVLITAGVHAREWAPPDPVLSFVEELLTAYIKKAPITENAFNYLNRGALLPGGGIGVKKLAYGPYVVPAADVQNMVNKLFIYVIPMVNPDGRDFSLDVEAFWRKNRKTFDTWQMVNVRNAAGGTYTLTFGGKTTAPIPFNANANAVALAVSKLTSVAPKNITAVAPLNVAFQQFVGPGKPIPGAGLLSSDNCVLLRFKPVAGVPHALMTANFGKLTGAPGGAAPEVLVNWGDGVDINRNFCPPHIKSFWKKEVYYTVAGEKSVSASGHIEEVPDAVQDYRGPAPQSEVETVNVSDTIQNPLFRPDYFLDIHAYAGKILVPWGIHARQNLDSSQWFGNKKWDRPGPHKGRPWPPALPPNPILYKEWFPLGLQKQHDALGNAMKAEIIRAAGANAAESTYPVEESAAGLYATTGAVDDFAVSLQFLPDNKEGDNKFALTFESGDENGFDGGFHPDPTTGQYEKVERDIHAAIVGLLLQVVAWATGGPPVPPVPAKH
jgi:hypothetical protein